MPKIPVAKWEKISYLHEEAINDTAQILLPVVGKIHSFFLDWQLSLLWVDRSV